MKLPGGKLKVSVVGLGKIGLPLAIQFALNGYHVIGVDINPETVENINSSIAPFPGEKDLDVFLASTLSSGLFSATTDFSNAISDSEVVIVVVPLFIGKNGALDFDSIDLATSEISRYIRKGTLVSYETTLPVGTTRKRFAKLLEEGSGLITGHDFFLVFSPERVLSGRVFSDLKQYPKLLGGINEISARKGVEFYSKALTFENQPQLGRENGVWDLGSCEAAELAKLAETTYRDVNIALVNQFAKFATKNAIDIYQVIEACNSQPYSHLHQPGIAVGGHCIPIYPQMYLLNDPEAEIVRVSRITNRDMPNFAIDFLESCHGNLKGQKVVILGASYRGGVKETAFSGVFSIAEALNSKGASVFVHDPLYTVSELRDLGFTPYMIGQEIDAAVLHSNHSSYLDLTPNHLPHIRTLLDGRNFLNPKLWESVNLIRLG